MKISYDWLGKLIDLDQNPTELSELLTNTGLEVEHVDEFEAIKGGLKGLVVGHVLTCVKHPNADKLKVTTVDIGQEEPVQIVCGAPNVDVGQRVVVAPVNSILYPEGHDPFKIKKAKIRGELSQGMICAEDEIGIGNDHDGIIVLPKNAQAGSMVNDLFDLKNDHVIEIGLTPNRGDAISHLGVARDVKAITGESIKFPEIYSDNGVSNTKLEIDIQDSELCPRYAGIVLKDLKIGPSPEWMQRHLKSLGLNPINNVVDITNYVLHELGQPIHAFDWNKINGGIIVRKAKAGEKLITLDEAEREFEGDELLICDSDKALAIGGVFGGIDSGVTETTSDVLIESAFFDAGSVRRTARRFGLNTDASFRFERGTDPNMVEKALRRVVFLLKEYAGAKVDSDIIDCGQKEFAPYNFSFEIPWLNSFCGTKLSQAEVIEILASLDIQSREEGDTLNVSVPRYRVDVTRPVDIAEEVLRIYGYNKVEIPSRLNITPAETEKFNTYDLKNKVAEALSGIGFNEIMNNSQTNDKDAGDSEGVVKMMNPLSQEYTSLRTSLLPGLINSLSYNWKRKIEDLKFYEFGKTYKKIEDSYKEYEMLLIGGTGSVYEMNWHSNTDKFDYYFLKSAVESIFNKCGISLHKIADLVEFKTLDKNSLADYDIGDDTNYALINWDGFKKAGRKAKFELKPIPKYPLVKRDVSAVIDSAVEFSSIENLVKKSARKYFRGINCFDVFEGDKLGKNKKAYAFSVYLYDEDKTMKDKQIDGILNQIIQSLEKELQAVIRR